MSRNNCEEVVAELKASGICAERYHAGLSSEERERIQRSWMAEEFPVIVATIAFGMGINKKDVRFVFHLCMPKCIENYFQESGRAGRDGGISYCHLYYDIKDRSKHQWLQDQAHGANLSKEVFEKGLKNMTEYCEELSVCRRELLLKHFGEEYLGDCSVKCDNCSRRSMLGSKPCGYEVDEIVSLVESLGKKKSKFGVTLIDLRTVLMGLKFKKEKFYERVLQNNPIVGMMKRAGWSADQTTDLLSKMVSMDILTEHSVNLPNRGRANYIVLGKNADRGSAMLSSFTLSCQDGIQSLLLDSMDTPSPAYYIPSPIRRRLDEAPDPAPANPVARLSEIQVERLFSVLLQLRKEIVIQFELRDASSVINLDGLRILAKELPLTLDQLRKLSIPGFSSKTKTDRYGMIFLRSIKEFLDTKSLDGSPANPSRITFAGQDDGMFDDLVNLSSDE